MNAFLNTGALAAYHVSKRLAEVLKKSCNVGRSCFVSQKSVSGFGTVSLILIIVNFISLLFTIRQISITLPLPSYHNEKIIS